VSQAQTDASLTRHNAREEVVQGDSVQGQRDGLVVAAYDCLAQPQMWPEEAQLLSRVCRKRRGRVKEFSFEMKCSTRLMSDKHLTHCIDQRSLASALHFLP
jgi:hypothetical protein